LRILFATFGYLQNLKVNQMVVLNVVSFLNDQGMVCYGIFSTLDPIVNKKKIEKLQTTTPWDIKY